MQAISNANMQILIRGDTDTFLYEAEPDHLIKHVKEFISAKTQIDAAELLLTCEGAPCNDDDVITEGALVFNVGLKGGGQARKKEAEDRPC
ncbi:unnamed protein product [Notodromas monacha]|uniref:Ubiquitin-like domain-containing protein n=1 Tax=Notodromas monacha TaxID=399045 RepID=A0A7R9GC35_9CRUS|nr:unnamed protein product [Notodromas monacha]CAG0917178.1 unnamed protein product [Notodromas monacha]